MAPARHATWRLIPCVCALLLAACASASPEQQLLIDFFRVARLGDRTRLANLATVTFDPNVDGSVSLFTIAKTGSDERRALDQGASSSRTLAARSLTPPGGAELDVSRLRLDAIRKTIVIDAALRSADGRVAPTRLSVTIERAVGVIDGVSREGRWIVTAVGRNSDSSASGE